MEFKDNVVWITGASSGIGEYLAYAFAEQGAKLALSARNEQELQRVKAQCPAGAEVLVAPLDVSDYADVPRVVRQILDHFGYLSMVINNAGISQRERALDTDVSVDRRIMDVNYFGTVAVTKAVLPAFVRQQFGHIVVISSVMGKIGTPRRSAYAASKHALHGFFDSLRAEVHPDNIAVTIICPGYVHTNITLNALRGDGSANARMADETRQGLAPDVFARRALRVIKRRRREALIGKKEILGVYIKRFFPGLLARIVRGMRVA